MRVTMVNKYYPPHLGGIEYHVRYLAEALVSQDHAQVRAIVANEGPQTIREIVGGVDVLRLSRSFAYASTPVAYDMPAAIRVEATRPDPADLLHLHFPYPWGAVSCDGRWRCRPRGDRHRPARGNDARDRRGVRDLESHHVHATRPGRGARSLVPRRRRVLPAVGGAQRGVRRRAGRGARLRHPRGVDRPAYRRPRSRTGRR